MIAASLAGRWWRAGAAMLAPVALSACIHLGAPGSVAPDRPGYTDTPTAMPARAVQVEAGMTDDQTGTAGARTEYRSAGEVLTRFGLGARTELRMFGNSYGIRTADGAPPARGMEDMKIGAKVNLRAIPDSVHSWLPNAALLAATTLPTGASALSAGVAQPEAKLAINWATASPFSLYSNVAWGALYNGSSWGSRGWASAAAWWAVNPRVSLFAEGLAVDRLTGSAVPARDVDGGVTYLINDQFQLDVRAGHGAGATSGAERFVGAGFAKRW